MSVISLHKTPVQNDIVGGLRKLADVLEEHGGVEGCDIVSTCVVSLGHAKVTPEDDGYLAHDVEYVMYSWGTRKDIFTIRGLLTTICNRL